MKKLLIVLMVIAMASFLFAGCIPSVPEEEVPEEEVPEEEVPVVVPAATDTPIITEIDGGWFVLSSAATQYINAFDVVAVAPIGSVVKLYVNDVWVGTDSSGAFGVTGKIAATAVIADGVKTIYVTATQPGLAVSAKSTIYTATLDTVRPKVIPAAFGISAFSSGLPLGYIEVTFDEAVLGSTITAAGVWVGKAQSPISTNVPVIATVKSATVAKLTEVTPATLATTKAFRVDCPATICDLAGNLLDLVSTYALGTVI